MIRTRTLIIVVASVIAALAASCGSDDGGATDLIDGDATDQETAEDIQDTLSDAFEELGLQSLASAVGEIDVRELTDADTFTFLAPGDEAFAALTAEDLADLLADFDRLTTVLETHVIPERLDAAALATRTEVTTESGVTLPVSVDGETIRVGTTTVVDADVDVGDGIVHVVDAVLIDATEQ